MQYLIDTNILIYFFNGELTGKSKSQVSKILQDSFNISIITYMEFLGFRGFSKSEFDKASQFLENANILHLTLEMAGSVVHLRSQKKIKLPDAIIAATASQNDLTLVTRNVDDFKGVDVSVVNPVE